MKGFELTSAELLSLRKAHKSEHYKRAAYKINALILLGSDWTLEEVKEALLLDEETLRSYVKKYHEGGIPELIKADYVGGKAFLNEAQTETLCNALDHQIFLTTQSVIDYVQKKFSVNYTQSGMRDLLHRLTYEYKKPKLVPGNPDLEDQEIFIEQYEDFMLKKTG